MFHDFSREFVIVVGVEHAERNGREFSRWRSVGMGWREINRTGLDPLTHLWELAPRATSIQYLFRFIDFFAQNLVQSLSFGMLH
jgi:hypothetical protein